MKTVNKELASKGRNGAPAGFHERESCTQIIILNMSCLKQVNDK